MSVYALALHTSSPELGLALSNFAGDSRANLGLGAIVLLYLHNQLAEFNSNVAVLPWKAKLELALVLPPER